MICNERLETLLNRAGNTLPETDYPDSRILKALGQGNVVDLAADYLYAVDIIDRMEWALDNVLRERDFLRAMAVEHGGCPTCKNADPNNRLMCAKYDTEDIPPDCYEYSGVPDNWEDDDVD